jgi:hypothetical protein
VLRNFLEKENPYKISEKTITTYFEGRKNADLSQLKNAFSADAILITIQDDKELIIPFFAYLNIVQKDGIQQVETQILEGDITNNIAYYKTSFIYFDKSYTDYITLVKKQNDWKIVSKTFTKIK